MIDPAIRQEAAHVVRRAGRAVATIEEWPFRSHRTQAEIWQAELDAAAANAGKRAEAAYDRATRP